MISIKNLTKNYKVHKKTPGVKGSLKALFKRQYLTKPAINNISFSLDQGELVGFIGPNGAGKTTTLKCLSGLIYPTSGQVEVLGYTPFHRKSEFLSQISLIMGQKQQLLWDLPAIESFNLNKQIYNIPNQQYKKILDQLIDMLDISQVISQPVRKMSLGQRMKCELVAALLHTPKVLFLDEPTIGLDVVVQKNLRQFIKQYNYEYNATIILTSHYMGDVQELCKRVIIIDQGRIGFDGPLEQLIRQYSQSKTITLVFDEKVTKAQLKPYGTLLHWQPLKATIELPRNQVKIIASQMLKDLPVDDLDIAEPAIEDIIGLVFAGTHPRTKPSIV